MLTVKTLWDSILRVYGSDSIQARVCLTQGVHESGLLNHPSRLAEVYNNLFGIKGKGMTGKTVLLPTWEMVNGKVVRVKAPFALNDSIDDSIRQYQGLMERPRYKRVRDAKTLDEAFKALYDCGYATDNQYARKLHNVYESIRTTLGLKDG